MRDRRRLSALASCALAATAMISGCATGSSAGPPVQHGGPRVTWVDLAETLPTTVADPRQYWESLVEQESLPYWATTYVVTLPSGWTADPSAVAGEVLSLHPTLVSVEAGLVEAADGTTPAALGAALDQLLPALAAQRVRVVVADVPALPGTGTPTPALVAYDSTISAAARAARDPVVDLSGRLSGGGRAGGAALFEHGSLTAAGEQAVAAAFEGAFKSALRT